MKKTLLFSMLAAFTLVFSSCAMVEKKDEKKKTSSQSPHRRYHTEKTTSK